MTNGTAVIAGYDIRTNLRQVNLYKPRVDAYLDIITIRVYSLAMIFSPPPVAGATKDRLLPTGQQSAITVLYF